MKKLLITGASGFLGWNCCRIAAENYLVTGLYNSHNCPVPGVDYIQCNITDTKKLDQIISGIKPSIIIHTAAISAPNRCQEEPVVSKCINVDVSGALARICRQRDVKFVFTSSDQVFSGNDAPYSEDSLVSPVNIYGKQKADAEQLIMTECPDAAVCRMPLMYGDAPEGATSFIIPWLEILRNSTPLKLFIDEMRTPVSARDAVCGLLLAAEKVHGVIHLGGKEVLSRYTMGVKLAEAAGLNIESIMPCKQKEITMSAPRPLDVSLKSSKAFSIGYNPGMFSDELKQLQNISR